MLATVPGEKRSRNTRCWSSQTAVVPFGERLGVPSGQTVATYPSRCSRTTRFMSSSSTVSIVPRRFDRSKLGGTPLSAGSSRPYPRKSAREAGGVSVACSISLPVEERPNPYVDQVVKFDHFFIRKEILIKSSFGFVAFPGGLGTFDEVFEAATLIHTGKIQSFPIVLLGRDFWDPLISFLTAQTHEGAMADCTTSHFYLADSPTDAVDHIRDVAMKRFGLSYATDRRRRRAGRAR